MSPRPGVPARTNTLSSDGTGTGSATVAPTGTVYRLTFARSVPLDGVYASKLTDRERVVLRVHDGRVRNARIVSEQRRLWFTPGKVADDCTFQWRSPQR